MVGKNQLTYGLSRFPCTHPQSAGYCGWHSAPSFPHWSEHSPAGSPRQAAALLLARWHSTSESVCQAKKKGKWVYLRYWTLNGKPKEAILLQGSRTLIWSTILRIWGSNPMSNILSASSSTRYVHRRRLVFPASRKSIKRPGVAMQISTPSQQNEEKE